jgi:hypothetical protein
MGCPKECINVTHSFTGKFSYSPEKKQYLIGDTLWLESTFSCKSQLNSETGKIEEFCGAKNLGTTLGITSLVHSGLGGEQDAVDSFTFINIKGRIYSEGTDAQKKFVKQIRFEQIDTNYAFRCGIIPLKKGVYYLGIGNAINVNRGNSKDCEKAAYSFTVGNLNNNIDIYFTYKGNNQISDYERPRGYWFEVK